MDAAQRWSVTHGLATSCDTVQSVCHSLVIMDLEELVLLVTTLALADGRGTTTSQPADLDML